MKMNSLKLNFVKRLFNNPVARSEAGFTLTEILIVIILIGVIATLAAQQLTGQFSKAKVGATKIKINQLRTILDQYKLDCNQYPSSEQTLEALLQKPQGGRECKNYSPEGYAKGRDALRDAWDQDFSYESDGFKYEIISLGADSQPGGEGYDADISSKEMEQ